MSREWDPFFIHLDATNDLLEVEVDVDRKTIICHFLHSFMITSNTKTCQIEYSIQQYCGCWE